MQTSEEALQSIQSAEPDTKLRVCRRIEIGGAIHQGDVYLHCVPDAHPRGQELGTRQVAIGTTVGSRHIVEGAGVSVFAGSRYPDGFNEPKDIQPNALLGPLVVANEAFTLTHPEHAHHRLPAGCYQVTYQADLISMRAVVD
jgi:hypothetical protein